MPDKWLKRNVLLTAVISIAVDGLQHLWPILGFAVAKGMIVTQLGIL